MWRGKGHLHKKWGNQIMTVRCCSSYMLFNFKSEWDDSTTALCDRGGSSAQTFYQTSNDSRRTADLGLLAYLRVHHQLSNLLANGKTPSRPPQAANYRFLTIILVHSVYASVQGLSRQIQCYNSERSQATPEEVSKFSET